jgi:hypothetical protein
VPRAKPRRGLLIAAALAIAVLVGALVLPSALSGDDGGTSRRPGAGSGSQPTSAVDQPVQPAQLEQRVQDLEDAINR